MVVAYITVNYLQDLTMTDEQDKLRQLFTYHISHFLKKYKFFYLIKLGQGQFA